MHIFINRRIWVNTFEEVFWIYIFIIRVLTLFAVVVSDVVIFTYDRSLAEVTVCSIRFALVSPNTTNLVEVNSTLSWVCTRNNALHIVVELIRLLISICLAAVFILHNVTSTRVKLNVRTFVVVRNNISHLETWVVVRVYTTSLVTPRDTIL